MRSLSKKTSDDRVCLEEILNTSDPKVKRYFAEVYYEELEKAEQRVIYRVADMFKHMLPASQQHLVAEVIRSMDVPVALAM